MGSERLKGKVLRPINGIPMLSYQIERLRSQQPDLNITIATSVGSQDDVLEDFCNNNRINVFRGSEANVLQRFHDAASQFQLNDSDEIIRLTGDCPLICPDLIKQLIHQYRATGSDYGRVDTDSYPRGVDAEIFTMAMLRQANSQATTEYDREHVTPYFYAPENHFKTTRLTNSFADDSGFRLCVDQEIDFIVVSQIIALLGDDWRKADYRQLIDCLKNHPEFSQLNRDVQQRTR